MKVYVALYYRLIFQVHFEQDNWAGSEFWPARCVVQRHVFGLGLLMVYGFADMHAHICEQDLGANVAR